MRVEMVTLYADHERSVQPGQQAVFPPDKAKALVAGGYARVVEEAAVRTRPAAAAKTRGKRGSAKPAPSEGNRQGGEEESQPPPENPNND